MKDYKVVNGISFDQRTPNQVCNILANYCGNRNQRVRLFYGDTTTGKDWFECYDTIGYIGRSTGTIKIPLLIATSRSLGGGAILDHCIVKITIDKQTVYKHPNYHAPIEQRGNDFTTLKRMFASTATLKVCSVNFRSFLACATPTNFLGKEISPKVRNKYI